MGLIAGRILIAGVTMALLSGGNLPVKTEAKAAASVNVAALAEADNTDKLILVIGSSNSSEAVFSYHEKKQDHTWDEVFTTPAIYGRNGSTADKKEGDGKTPQGAYTFSMSFGIKDDPQSVLPYHKIKPNDYWVDDSDSKYYNTLVNTDTTKKSWKSAEHMASQAPYYNYGLALNYNPDCVPGKGSAIFLHCTGTKKDSGSAGCIRIPEALMKQLIGSVDGKTKIIIVSDISQLEYK